MSADHTERERRIQRARSRALWGLDAEADKARGLFFVALDGADVEVTDFEAQFIESYLSAAVHADWWTDPRRGIADKMQTKYGGRI